MKYRKLADAFQYVDDKYLDIAEEMDVSSGQGGMRVKRQHRIKTGVCAAAILAIVLLLGTVTAYALGYDLWGAIGRWTAETFHFEIHSETTETRLNPEVKAALEKFQIPESLIPVLRLEGFELIQQEFLSDALSDTAFFAYQDENNGFYSVEISRYFSESYLEKHIFEKDAAPIEEYTSGGKRFYILLNLDTITATWSDGVFLESITGSLTVNEVKEIIDSIGEDNNRYA